MEIRKRSKFRHKNQECKERRGTKATVDMITGGSVESRAVEYVLCSFFP